MPPDDLGEMRADGTAKHFAPAVNVLAWAQLNLLEDGGDLHNPDHQHLLGASIGFLWASGGYVSKGRRVLGLTERLQFMCNPWQKQRQLQQMHEWFGATLPDFLITLDAGYCATCSDAEFCALVEHELYHIGQEVDEFGVPAFDRDGNPKLKVRGHDVEEFVGVVRRYGLPEGDSYLGRLVRAAQQAPEVAPIKIAQACGTCLLKAA